MKLLYMQKMPHDRSKWVKVKKEVTVNFEKLLCSDVSFPLSSWLLFRFFKRRRLNLRKMGEVLVPAEIKYL
jgi:hypothetical protein